VTKDINVVRVLLRHGVELPYSNMYVHLRNSVGVLLNSGSGVERRWTGVLKIPNFRQTIFWKLK